MSKLKNPYFILSCIALIFSASGVDFNELTSWPLLLNALLGIVNNNCSLFIPDTQVIDNCETTSVIKILKQYISLDTPSFFCINKDASILACNNDFINSLIRSY